MTGHPAFAGGGNDSGHSAVSRVRMGPMDTYSYCRPNADDGSESTNVAADTRGHRAQASGAKAFEALTVDFDRIVEWLVIILLLFMPFAFGAVEAWSEEIVVAIAAAICVCLCMRMVVARGPSLPWTWAYLPILAFVGLAVMQLIPLPMSIVRWLSPNTVAQKMKVLVDLHDAGSLATTTELSFYAHATKHDLRLLLAAGSVFVAVVGVFRRPDQIVRLLLAVASIGAAVALLALVQDVAGNGKIYGFVTSPHGTAFSGPFVNHSHYAQFMNLSIGAALALICVKTHQALGGRKTTPAAVVEYLSSADGRLIWGLAAMIVLGAGTIFASLSRGGMISLMMASAFTTLVLSSKGSFRGTGWVMAMLALAAFVCVLYIGFDAVYDRLGSLRQLHHAQGGRWQIVRDVAVAWTRFPIVGTGLGTHEVVYPMFDRSTVAALASHAENEYAQAAEETGIIGMAALVAFGALVWSSYARVIRRARWPIHSAAYGLGFGLAAIMIQSLSDFGQHLPANMFLSVIYCALLLRLPHIGAGDSNEVVSSPGRVRRYWGAALAVLVLVWSVVLLDADHARRGQAHWQKSLAAEGSLVERHWQGSDEEYAYLLGHARKAAAHQPDNVLYRHWLNVYRWRAISRTLDPNTGEIVLSAEALQFARRIAAELNRTRMLCSTFGATWCVLGQLERLVPDQAELGARHIREGVRLAPCDPTARFVAGFLETEEGRTDEAVNHFAKAVQLDEKWFREVALHLIDQLGRSDLALEIARGRVDRLITIAGLLETSGGREAADETWREVAVLLEQICREPDAPAAAFARLAWLCQRNGRIADAIRYYGQALVSDYSQVEWRLSLALLLAETGEVGAAIEQANVCLRFRPEFAPARRLIDRLSLDPRLGN